MKISIIGAGAMGSLYGGYLARSGHDVLLYDINREHVDAVNEKGLDIEEPGDGASVTVHPRATTDPDGVKDSDFLIIFVKSTVTELVARTFRERAGDSTIAVSMQNGVGNEVILRNAFGAHRTAAGVTAQGATFLEPGKIRHAGTGPTHLCMSDRENDKLTPFMEALNNAGFESDLSENIESLVWSKLIINVGINALTALTRLHNGQLLDFEETKDLIRDLVEEGVAVAQAKGLTLTYENPVERVLEVCDRTAQNRSSMLQDFDRGSATEIDFINGAVVEEGKTLGIATPVNRTVTRLVRTWDKKQSLQKGKK